MKIIHKDRQFQGITLVLVIFLGSLEGLVGVPAAGCVCHRLKRGLVQGWSRGQGQGCEWGRG